MVSRFNLHLFNRRGIQNLFVCLLSICELYVETAYLCPLFLLFFLVISYNLECPLYHTLNSHIDLDLFLDSLLCSYQSACLSKH